LTETEAAAYLRIRPNTLAVWRCKQRGPQYIKLGSRVIYDPDDLDAFMTAHKIITQECEFGSPSPTKEAET
jgi:hypothetical protein